MATSDSPLSVPNVTLAVARGAAPGLSAGTNALSVTIAALERDAEVTVSTDGTYDFGSVGPDFVALFDATLTDAENAIIPILGPNSTVVSGSAFAEAQAKMPGGVGLTVTTNDSYKVQTVAHTRGFESRTYYWPQAHQDNATPFLTDPESNPVWQLKPVWITNNFATNADGTDFYLVTWQRFFDGGTDTRYWQDNTLLSGNTPQIGQAYNSRVVTKGSGTSPGKMPLDEPYTTDFLYDQGDLSTTNSGSLEIETHSPSQGAHYPKIVDTNKTLHDPDAPLSQRIVNAFTYMPYKQGFDHTVNQHPIEGELYKAAGPGASCRIVITDNPDHALAGKKTILEPVFGAWSNTQARAKLRGGWWAINDLSGKYLCVIGSDNTQIGTGVQI